MIKRKIILLLGPANIGKTTQCALLAKIMPSISVQDVIKQLHSEGNAAIKSLGPNDINDIPRANEIVAEFVIKNNMRAIIDGYPRSVMQAKFIKDFSEQNNINLICIYLNSSSDAVLFDRGNNSDSELLKLRLYWFYFSIFNVLNVLCDVKCVDGTLSVTEVYHRLLKIIND